MSVFYNNPTDAQSNRRPRFVRIGDKRTQDYAYSRTTIDRFHGEALERNPNRQMRITRQAAIVRNYRQSSEVKYYYKYRRIKIFIYFF